MDKKISLVICNKNYNPFLPDLFESLVNQTFQDFEIIFLDYGSDTKPTNIIKKYKEILDIKYMEKRFGNRSGSDIQHARNYAIEHVNTDTICVIELDSIYYPQFFEIMYNELYSDEKIGYVYCNFEYMRRHGKMLCVVPEFNPKNIKSWQTCILLKKKHFVPFNRDFFKLQDWEWALSMKTHNDTNGKKVSITSPLWMHKQPNGGHGIKSISWKYIREHNKYKVMLKELYPDIFKL